MCSAFDGTCSGGSAGTVSDKIDKSFGKGSFRRLRRIGQRDGE